MLELLELAPPALLARKQARAPQISRSARDGDCMLRVFRTKKKNLGRLIACCECNPTVACVYMRKEGDVKRACARSPMDALLC